MIIVMVKVKKYLSLAALAALLLLCSIGFAQQAKVKSSGATNTKVTKPNVAVATPQKMVAQIRTETPASKNNEAILEIRKKIREIEASTDMSDEQRNQEITSLKAKLADLGAPESDYFFNEISFTPTVIPTEYIGKLREVFGDSYLQYFKNIVVVNKAYSLDFNNYQNRDMLKKVNEMIADYKYDETTALVYLFPNIAMQYKYCDGKDAAVFNALKLYFANQPALHSMLPTSIITYMQDSRNGIQKLIEMQNNAYSKTTL